MDSISAAARRARRGVFVLAVALLAACGGGGGNQTVSAPPPTVNFINASSASAGCADFDMYVTGTWFNTQSTVLWNGSPRPTTLLSGDIQDGMLRARIAAADVASAGTAQVAVTAPGQGVSNAVRFTISAFNGLSPDASAFRLNPAHTGAALSPCPVSLPPDAAWSVAMPTPSYALITAERVFALDTTNQQLSALDPAGGAVLWGPVSVPRAVAGAYDAGSVYVTSAGGSCCAPQVLAFDAGTGAARWNAVLIDGASGPYHSSPVAADGIVAATVANGAVGVRQADGSLAWSNPASGTEGTLAISGNGVYLDYPCTKADYVPASGAETWKYSPGCSGGGGGMPVVASGRMYTSDGSLFDAATGALLGEGVRANFPPAFSGDYGYYLNGQLLTAIRVSDNAVLWSFAGDQSLIVPPIVINQTVFIASANGLLYTLDAPTGHELSRVSLPQPLQPGVLLGSGWGTGITPTLQAGHGLLVVPTAGRLVAYRISSR